MQVQARRHTTAAAAVLMLLATAACGEDDPVAEPAPSAQSGAPSTGDTATDASSDTASATPTPDDGTTTAPAPVTGTVWFMVDTRAGLRLVREQRALTGEDPALEAVQAMVAGPTDPDYTTTWNPETEVLSVEVSGDGAGEVATVDLSEEARTASVGSEGAALMVQQLVYTVTDAVGEDAAVELLIEGEPAGELWGAVSWDGPERRDDPLDVRALVQVDSPREGETVASPVRVRGVAAAFEATVLWRVLDATGTEVRTGFATAEEGMTLSPYSFRVRLRPGTYTLEVSEDDPSGGEGGEPMTDSRTFIVE